MSHLASSRSRPAVKIGFVLVDFEKTDVKTDGRTCVYMVITTGRDCGRPGGSIRKSELWADVSCRHPFLPVIDHILLSAVSKSGCLQCFFASTKKGQFFLYWPTRPRLNRWSLFSYRVSVRPSLCHRNKNIQPGKQNTLYKKTMRENNDDLLAGAWWVILKSPDLFLL